MTDFERRVTVRESEAGEQLSDLIKIGVVVKGLEKGNFRDHLLINTSGTKQWSRFIKELEAVELARLNSGPTPMDLSAVVHDQPKRFDGDCLWCGMYGHMVLDCWKKGAAQSQSSKGSQSWNTSQWSQWGDRGGGKDHGKGKGKGKSKSKGKGKGKKGSKGFHEMEDQSSEQEGYSQEWYEWHEDSGPGGTEWHEGQWDSYDSYDQNSISWETPNDWTGTASSSQQAAPPNTGGSIQMLGGLDLCAIEKWDRNTMKKINVRTDQSNFKITFGVDTAACRTVVPGNHPAARGYRVHWDSGAGVPYSTAGKSMVWDEGRRLLVAKQATGEPITIESPQATVRRPLMAVKPMTAQGQWVCFGPDRAFAYKIETGRVIPFESTPTGWNLTMELEAPENANKKLQEAMDTKIAELRTESQNPLSSLPTRVKELMGESTPIHPFGRQGTSLQDRCWSPRAGQNV